MNIFRLVALLPMLIQAAEIVHGVKEGQIKKAAVLTVIFGFVKQFAPALNTPANQQLLSLIVDETVKVLNETGIFPKRAYAGT